MIDYWNKSEVLAWLNLACGKVDIYLVKTDPQTQARQLATEITWTPVEEGFGYHKPTLQIQESEGQHLMDMLWNCGFRPVEGKGSMGALAATKAHLADLQIIVSKQLDVKLGK